MNNNAFAELIAEESLMGIPADPSPKYGRSLRLFAVQGDIDYRNEQPDIMELSFGMTGLAPLGRQNATRHTIVTIAAVSITEQPYPEDETQQVDVQPATVENPTANCVMRGCVALTVDGGLAAVVTGDTPNELYNTTIRENIDSVITPWRLNIMRRVVGRPTEPGDHPTPDGLYQSEKRSLEQLTMMVNYEEPDHDPSETLQHIRMLVANLTVLLQTCRQQHNWDQVLAATISLVNKAAPSEQRDELLHHLQMLDGNLYAQWLLDSIRYTIWGIRAGGDAGIFAEQASIEISQAAFIIDRYLQLLDISAHLNLG